MPTQYAPNVTRRVPRRFYARADYGDIAARDAARTQEYIWAPSPTHGMNAATYGGLLYGGCVRGAVRLHVAHRAWLVRAAIHTQCRLAAHAFPCRYCTIGGISMDIGAEQTRLRGRQP